MPDLDERIKNYVEGDALKIRRTVDRAASKIDSGRTVVSAWLRIVTDPKDPDASEVLKKTITTIDNPGVGQIENDGTADADPVVRFDIEPGDTTGQGGVVLHYDIQLKLDDGTINTPVVGKVKPQREYTKDA